MRQVSADLRRRLWGADGQDEVVMTAVVVGTAAAAAAEGCLDGCQWERRRSQVFAALSMNGPPTWRGLSKHLPTLFHSRRKDTQRKHGLSVLSSTIRIIHSENSKENKEK